MSLLDETFGEGVVALIDQKRAFVRDDLASFADHELVEAFDRLLGMFKKSEQGIQDGFTDAELPIDIAQMAIDALMLCIVGEIERRSEAQTK